MPTDSVNDYSVTAALNTNIAGVNIDIGCPPADVGYYMRTQMAQLAYCVQGTPGLFAATWHVGTLTAAVENVITSNVTTANITTANITTLIAAAFAPSSIASTGPISGTQITPTSAVVPVTGMFGAAGNLGFATGTTLRMFFDPAGIAYFGTTQANPITAGVGGMTFASASATLILNSPATPASIGTTVTTGNLVNFFTGGNVFAGSISGNGANVGYNTTSDETLKVHIGDIALADAAGAIDQLCALWFSWKSDPRAEAHPGFFAQQVHRICPWAVTPGRGRPGEAHYRPWQMDAGKLMPFVIAYIQGLSKRVTDLEKAKS